MVSYLKGFIEQNPHVKITIESQSSTHTLNMLEQQVIDVGLIAEPRLQRGLTFLPVMDIEDIFVATPAYLENLRLREGRDADVFQVGNIMLLDKDNITRNYIDDYMEVNHINVNQVLEVTTMDLLIEFARIGLGIGSVIKEFVQDDLNSGRLVQLRLDYPIHKRTVGFAYQTNRTSKALNAFIRYIQSQTQTY
jgi:DNA-binding transcriptional LysR family regulator